MRVLLLNPPTAAPADEVFLGMAYLAAVLRKAGHEVKIVDATAPYKPVAPAEVRNIIAGFQPVFIGISLTLTNVPRTYLFMKGLRSLGLPIVAGGPQATNCPHEALENGADFVVIGEGENTVTELAEYFSGKRKLHEITGLCFMEGAKASFTGARKLIEDLDTIPFPDFADFPIRNYTGSGDPDSNLMFWSVFTSRGCPYDCAFCSSHNVFGKLVRTRSAENVFEEIKGLVARFGVKTITFQDDEVLCSKKRFLRLCDLITSSRLKLKMSIRTRIDSIDKETLLRMEGAGITRISFGVESWNDETLEKINKRYKVRDIHEKFKIIEEAGFPHVSFNNICGFPWETKNHLHASLKEISRIPRRIRYFTNTVTIVPYPGTKLYNAYHQKFNFTGWWLDPERNRLRDEPRGKTKPFFLSFASAFATLYRRDIFWNYSRSMLNSIKSFSWNLFAMFARRHFGFFKFMAVYLLCRLSYFTWKLSPRLELAAFWLIRRMKMSEEKEKLFFNSKY